MGFFETLGELLDDYFLLFSIGASSDMAVQLSILFSTYLTLTVVIKGYETIAGISQSPVSELMWDFGKKALIMTFALNYGGYFDFIVEAVNGIHDWAGGGTSVYASLDILGLKAKDLAVLAYNKSTGGWSLGFLIGRFAQLLILVGFFLIAVPAFVVLIITSFTLKIILMLAPLIITLMFFGWLKNIFTQALNILISNFLTVMIVSILLNSLGKYIDKMIAYSNNGLENNVDAIYIGIQFLVFSIIFASIITKATEIAKELGVASIESTGKAIASSIGRTSANIGRNAAGGAKKAGGAIQSYRNKRKLGL